MKMIEPGQCCQYLGITGKKNPALYLLKLGDGSSWKLVATSGTRSWAEKLATIMRLKADDEDRHNEFPRIYLVQRYSGTDRLVDPVNLTGSAIEKALPKSGWKPHDLRPIRFWSHRALPDIICEIGKEGNHELDIIRMWTLLYIIYLRVQDSGGLPFHAALVEQDGKGVLLAGPGGSGKSTSSRRLPRPWYALSDDQSLIVCNTRKRYLAHPIPTWSDYLWKHSEKTWNVQYSVPLTGVFFLEQSEADEIKPLGEGQAAVLMAESVTQVCEKFWRTLAREDQRAFRKEIFNNACEMAKQIPAYRLCVSLNDEFWKKMEKVIGR